MFRAGRLGLAIAMLAIALAGCGQTPNGTIIGVRPGLDVPAAGSQAGPDLSSISAAFAAQLDASSSVPSLDEDTLAPGELPLDTPLSLRQYERLEQVQQLGTKQVEKGLAAIYAMQRTVAAERNLTAGQKAQLNGRLTAAATKLLALGYQVTKDPMVDMARADVLAMARLRIHGLLLPQTHLMIAAYDLQRLVATLQTQAQSLKQRAGQLQQAGRDVSHALALIADLDAQVGFLNRAAANALYVLPRLGPEGYPDNRSALAQVRDSLHGTRSAAARAGNDVAQARAAIDSARL